MFIVSQNQLAQLDSLYLDRLMREIESHVRAFFPEDYARFDVDELAHFVREGIRRARAYGLTTDRNTTVFVDFLMTYGAAFPENHPWGKPILEDNTRSEDQKIASLLVLIDE